MGKKGSQWAECHKSLYLSIFRISVQNIKVETKSGKNNGTLHENQYTFMEISSSIRLRMRNFPDQVAEKIKTPIQ
jgi:hypothetical protein